LFKLALANLEPYPAVHEGLHVSHVTKLMASWYNTLALSGFATNPLTDDTAPQLNVFSE
jgi:hypothetical protein